MKDLRSSILVIGIGNEFRSDDGAGIVVARAIEGKKLPGVTVIEQSGEGAALMDILNEADNVYLVDAVSSGVPAGTVYRIDVRTGTFPSGLRLFSTHAFGVAQAVELARSMNTLPPRLIIFGVEGKNFESGKNLSSEVLHAAGRVVQLLSNEIFSIVSQGSN